VTARDVSLPRRLWEHGFPLVRLALGIKGTDEPGWSKADPPFDGWDVTVNRPGIRGWLERGCNVGCRSGHAPRLEDQHPAMRYAFWLDLDWGHLSNPCSCGSGVEDHHELRVRYDTLLAFCRERALLVTLSVSGDDGYGALFAGSTPRATRDDIFGTRSSHGVDLVAFYGVSSTGSGSQKAIPPSRIVPGLLDTDEQRRRLRRTEYTVVVDSLDDLTRWSGQVAAVEELSLRFRLGEPRTTIRAPSTPPAVTTIELGDIEEVYRRLGAQPLGRAHAAVLRRLRDMGHLHGVGHAEVRWALSAPLAITGLSEDRMLDMLGYPAGERCRENRGRRLVRMARAHPVPFGWERLCRVPLYSNLPADYWTIEARPVLDPDLVEWAVRQPRRIA